mgnify:CR=1 FL=1
MNNNQYDEIKSLLKRSRLLTEQPVSAPNIGADIEEKIDQDEQKTPKDQYKKYRVSGGILVIHGSNTTETSITTDDKTTFQETMDEFVAEAYSNPDFQKFLAKVPYQNQTAWGAFTQAVAKLLGIKNSNALTEVIALTEELTSTESQTGKPSRRRLIGAEEEITIVPKEALRERTPQANAAMELMDSMGRKVAEPEPGYVEKVRQSWNNARDNPSLAREQSLGAFRRFLDWIQTKAPLRRTSLQETACRRTW